MNNGFKSIQHNHIEESDRVYVRLCVNGEKIIDLFIEGARNVSEVIREVLARAGKGLGLTKLYIRNITRGWSNERLYLVR